VAPRWTREAFGRLKPTIEKLNETATLASDRVHICEIVVIPVREIVVSPGAAGSAIPTISPDRLPFA